MVSLFELAAKKFWPPARARRKRGVGEIPPRPSVAPPPALSGAEPSKTFFFLNSFSFRSKRVRVKCIITAPNVTLSELTIVIYGGIISICSIKFSKFLERLIGR